MKIGVTLLFAWIIKKWTTRDRIQVTRLSDGHILAVKYLGGRIVYASQTTPGGHVNELFYEDARHPNMITKTTSLTKDGRPLDVVYYNDTENPRAPSKTISYFEGEQIEEVYLSDGTIKRTTESESWKIEQHLLVDETLLMEKTTYESGVSVQCWYDNDYTFTLSTFPTGTIKEVEDFKNTGIRKEVQVFKEGVKLETMTCPDGSKRKSVFDNDKLVRRSVTDSTGRIIDVYAFPEYGAVNFEPKFFT